MEKFTNFLKEAKLALDNLQSFENIEIVVGNESCDLDSTVSALTLAYLKKTQNSSSLVLPILNVKSEHFIFRTETCYLLNKYGIDKNTLIFINEINLDAAFLSRDNNIATILVDHHVLPNNLKILQNTITEIFDHRPINIKEICKNDFTRINIKTVGSCATLIANEIITNRPDIIFKELAFLLYATIIYDTIGLNKDAGRTFEEDLAVCAKLEAIMKPEHQNPSELFNVLWKVHNDTSSLTSRDLLYRDLKIVCGIPVPGLPLLVEDYLKRHDALDAIKSFASEFDSDVIVLIGIDASDGDVKRDVAIYSNSNIDSNHLIDVFNNEGSDLLLAQTECGFTNMKTFRQNNIKLTRKFIIPLIEKAAVMKNNKLTH